MAVPQQLGISLVDVTSRMTKYTNSVEKWSQADTFESDIVSNDFLLKESDFAVSFV